MALAIKLPLIFCVSSLIMTLQCAVVALGNKEKFPCMFVFGDSLVDNGNNNDLATEAKVDYLPYGIDYPEGPTGRFTNGRNTADFLAKYLGFKRSVLPFAKTQGQDHVMKGVNYASGSAGICSETGTHLGDNISIDKQLVNHNVTISSISQLLGNVTKAKRRLSKCLYFFLVGSNDYINNYYVPECYNTSTVYTPKEYATVLVKQYCEQLKTLYSYGARKVLVSGLAPLGCIPQSLARGTNESACNEPINEAVKLFNHELKHMVKELSHNLEDAKFIYNGAMALKPSDLTDMGLRIISKPCCKVCSKTGQCIKGESPCRKRVLHAYFDNIHPTQTVNKAFATATYIRILKKFML